MSRDDRHKKQPPHDQTTGRGDAMIESDRGRTAASEELSELMETLTKLETQDKRAKTFSLNRLTISYEALAEADRVCRMAGSTDESASTQIIRTCNRTQNVLSDLEKVLQSANRVAPACHQLAAAVADKLASFWARNAPAEEAVESILPIIKSLSKISGLGKVSNVDVLPEKIRNDAELTPLQRFCILGCLRSYYAALGAEGRTAELERACFSQQVAAASDLLETQPPELRLLKDPHPRAADTSVANLPLSLLVESVFAASNSFLDRGLFNPAKKALDHLQEYSSQLNEETLRAWLTRYVMVCRPPTEIGEVTVAKKMLQEAEAHASALGSQFTSEALRIQAERVKVEMTTARKDDHSKAELVVATFLSKFAKLDERSQLDLIDEALVVYQASVTLHLFKVEEVLLNTKEDPTEEDPIDSALRAVADMGHLLDCASPIERFRMVESLLDVAQACCEQEDPDHRQLELIQQASDLLQELEAALGEEALYQTSMCRAQVAQTLVMSEVGRADVKTLRRVSETLQQNVDKLSLALSGTDIADYVEQAYSRARVVLLSSLAHLRQHEQAPDGDQGLTEIMQAIDFYHRSMDPEDRTPLGSAIFEHGRELAELNQNWGLAQSYQDRLDNLW